MELEFLEFDKFGATCLKVETSSNAVLGALGRGAVSKGGEGLCQNLRGEEGRKVTVVNQGSQMTRKKQREETS